MKEFTREELIAAIEADIDERPGCAVMVGDLLVGWHSSKRTPYDALVFEEFCRGDDLVEWQNKLLLDAPHKAYLGHMSPHRLATVWAVSFLPENPFSVEVIAALKERFGSIY